MRRRGLRGTQSRPWRRPRRDSTVGGHARQSLNRLRDSHSALRISDGSTGNLKRSSISNLRLETSVTMDHDNSRDLIVSAIHFDLTPSLHAFVRQKTGRLFRHEERILRIRVELAYEPRRPGCGWFVAKGHIGSNGLKMNASVGADECHKAIALLADKLDRMLQRHSTLQKARRHQLHAVELPVALPKACRSPKEAIGMLTWSCGPRHRQKSAAVHPSSFSREKLRRFCLLPPMRRPGHKRIAAHRRKVSPRAAVPLAIPATTKSAQFFSQSGRGHDAEAGV